uniref:Uncharacterized protein n=1 Tax=Oryza sativa subsp. japonica TaxID=39947 RepID=Q6ZL72_ORYSJ|nr:hypothetical protein [Oryza sativa Japonica Group]
MEEDPPAADRSRSLSQPHLPMASEREKRRGGEREERTQRRFKITRRGGERDGQKPLFLLPFGHSPSLLSHEQHHSSDEIMADT